MPRKPRTAKRTRRRSNRSKSARGTRIVLITLSFILILFFGLYGVNYLKQHSSLDLSGKKLSASEMDNLIKNIDRSLKESYFEAGISSKNIDSKKVYNKEDQNLVWEYKDIRISAEPGLTSEKVKRILEESVVENYPVEYQFKGGKNTLTVLIRVNDITTHKIQFDFPKVQPVKTKTEKQVVKKPVSKSKEEPEKTKEVESSDSSQTESTNKAVTQNLGKSKIVIIVDDLGMQKTPIDQLLEIPEPLTFAVLPNLPYSSYAADKADKKGWDVILHMPMEPKESSGYTGTDAGDEVLLVGLPKDEILTILNRSISSLPHIKGVNNHMGSKFMENSELTELILEDIKSKGLIFVDSKTSGQSKGYNTARRLGMDAAQRDLFLDDVSKKPEYVKSQLKKLVKISKKKGYAVGICHPYPGTVEALSEMIPKMKDDVEVVSISNIINNSKQIGKK